MKTKNTLAIKLVLLSIFASLANCEAQNPTEILHAIPEGYESCCGTQPVTFKSEKTSIYIPNVFTPNGDGINDVFIPSVNSEVLTLVNFTVLTPGKDTVLHHVTFLDVKKLREYAWDGKRRDGTLYSGAFRYGMQVLDQQRKMSIIEGEACAIPCRKEMDVFRTKEGCYYPVQEDKNGDVDKAALNLEKECVQ